jgi:uncharacterized protein
VAFELPEARSEARRTQLLRWASFAIVIGLVALLAYLAFLGFAGSGALVKPSDPSADCRTPASAFGWDYEAVNYDRASDDGLAAEVDRMHCSHLAAAAGSQLTAFDGVHLAAWYIPAGGHADATAATVVLAHDYGANKSDMLEWAAVLHDDYNLVLFDFRNHGQSGAAPTTAGLNEARDLRAVVDWLESAKRPREVALLGVSMGAAAAADEAADDARVTALILDSSHATLANALQARLEEAGYPLALPGAWSILFGGLLRTGQDMSAVDPVQTIARYSASGRPVLIVAAGRDREVGSGDAESLLMAARDTGAPAELEVCDAAVHDGAVTTCADDYRTWVLGFLGRSLAP